MKRKTDDKPQSSFAGIAIIIAAVLLILAAVLWWMNSVGLLFLPDFVEDMLGLSDDEPVSWNIGELQSAVKNGKGEDGEIIAYEATYENIMTAFLESKPASGEFADATVSYYVDSTPVSRRVLYFRNGDRHRAEQYGFDGGDSPQIITVGTNGSYSRLDSVSGTISKYPAAEGFCFANDVGIPSVDAVIYAVKQFPEDRFDIYEEPETLPVQPDESESVDENAELYAFSDEAGVEGITDCDIKLIKADNKTVYYVCFTWAEYGITEEYYLSLDYRSVVYMCASKDGSPFYSYETKRISYDPEVYSDSKLYTLS